MSKRVFYGTSTSGSDEATKQVFLALTDEEKQTLIEDDRIQFLEGDILNVTFAQENTATTVSLVIQLGQTEEETSTADDVGKFVKSLDVDFIGKGAWAAGETVGFCYVIHGTEDDTTGQAAYWAAVDAGVATGDIYGVTKLHPLDDSTDSFDDWWNGGVIDNSNDYSTAMTPATLKEFYKKFLKPVDEEEGKEKKLNLNWVPCEKTSVTDTYSTLGVLSLNNGSEGINIEIPSSILEKSTVKYTGQLFNNGNGSPDNPFDEDAEPFITRHVPDNLYFNTSRRIGEGTPEAFENIGFGISAENPSVQDPIYDGQGTMPTEDQLKYYIRFDPDYLVLGYNGGQDFKGVKIRPELITDTAKIKTTIAGTPDSNSLNTPVAITSYGDIVVPKWTVEEGETLTRLGVSSPIIYENDIPLHKRYGPNFRVFKFSTYPKAGEIDPVFPQGVVIGPNTNTKYEQRVFFKMRDEATTLGKHIYVGDQYTVDGITYHPIGVIDYNIDYAVEGRTTDGRYANVWELYVHDTDNANSHINAGDIQVGFGNFKGADINVHITIWVLAIADVSVYTPTVPAPASENTNTNQETSTSTEESGS